jgi:hypothetical protein
VSWGTHGHCPHGHPVAKRQGSIDEDGCFYVDSDGLWTRELAPEACPVCPRGAILSTHVQHPSPARIEVRLEPGAPPAITSTPLPAYEEHSHRTEDDGHVTYELRRLGRPAAAAPGAPPG